MKMCPRCNLINPDTAILCDCEYNFKTKQYAPTLLPSRFLVTPESPTITVKSSAPICNRAGKDALDSFVERMEDHLKQTRNNYLRQILAGLAGLSVLAVICGVSVFVNGLDPPDDQLIEMGAAFFGGGLMGLVLVGLGMRKTSPIAKLPSYIGGDEKTAPAGILILLSSGLAEFVGDRLSRWFGSASDNDKED